MWCSQRVVEELQSCPHMCTCRLVVFATHRSDKYLGLVQEAALPLGCKVIQCVSCISCQAKDNNVMVAAFNVEV